MEMADNRSRLVLVTGATGHQGGAVARHLLDNDDFRVRALTRDPGKSEARQLAEDGAEIIKGDMDDRDSIDRALEGVYGVFAMQNFWETGAEREVEQGVRLADAAQAAGVRHFVYSSVGSAHRDTGLAHFESKWEIENHIRGIGIPYTILRPVFFMDNWENPMMADAVLGGAVVMPLSPDREFQQVAVDDIGAFVALALNDRDAWLGRELDLAGDERTVTEIAAAFGRVLGQPVEYKKVEWDDYRAAAGDEYHDMMRWFEDVGYDSDIDALRRIRPELTDFETYLEKAGWADREPSEAAATGN
jgi:uncharacterized protein YbjT (DUF2867 family)